VAPYGGPDKFEPSISVRDEYFGKRKGGDQITAIWQRGRRGVVPEGRKSRWGTVKKNCRGVIKKRLWGNDGFRESGGSRWGRPKDGKREQKSERRARPEEGVDVEKSPPA